MANGDRDVAEWAVNVFSSWVVMAAGRGRPSCSSEGGSKTGLGDVDLLKPSCQRSRCAAGTHGASGSCFARSVVESAHRRVNVTEPNLEIERVWSEWLLQRHRRELSWCVTLVVLGVCSSLLLMHGFAGAWSEFVVVPSAWVFEAVG